MSKEDFAFKGPEINRRKLLTAGAGGATRLAVRGTAAEVADPLIAEAEHVGRAHAFWRPGLNGITPENFLRKEMAKHPVLGKYAEHAVKAFHEANKLNSKHDEFLFKSLS